MKKTLVVLLTLVICFGSFASFADSVYFDTASADQGVISVSYRSNSGQYKVMVQKGSDKVFYNLVEDEISVPLTYGNGNYKIALLEKVSGKEYKFVDEKSLQVKMASSTAPYLTSSQTVNWTDANLMKATVNALVNDEMSDEEIVEAVYNYVVNTYSYDYEKINGLTSLYTPNIDAFMQDGSGICYDYSALFAGMLRSQGIPTKLVKGYRSGIDAYHAWNEVYIDGQWIVVDTTSDSILKASGMFTMMQQDSRLFTVVHTY
jgi:transglutaminase-like putative cysteine protease